jgi:hypothetical protein
VATWLRQDRSELTKRHRIEEAKMNLHFVPSAEEIDTDQFLSPSINRNCHLMNAPISKKIIGNQ